LVRTRRLRIGIDTGGTFTDVVAVDEATGDIWSIKTASTPRDPSLGLAEGIRKVLARAGLGTADGTVIRVSHGTTVATNALLEEQFASLGLIITRGFRHVLEIARQSVPAGYGNSYSWVKPDRIVPLERVMEVDERLSFRGEVLRPFDVEQAAGVARRFRERGVDTLGVVFLHSYANPEHERRMLGVLRAEHPDAWVSISSEVLPEYREYERSVTTLVDAFVKPKIATYVGRCEGRVRETAGPVPFVIMKSNGGVENAGEIVERPITTLLSGPAAGALGASYVAHAAGFDRVLTLDAGGTSTDICLVEAGEPLLTTEGEVGRFPVKTPMIDIVTVGTGGGSIAWIDPNGGLRVGPRSAGAAPGPMCYGRGGDEPTVTDANLVLGRIPPHLLGGEIGLDRDLARRGVERLAGRLGLSLERAAAGVLEIANWNQANATRQVTVRRGRDARDYTLVAFGGAGPLQAGRLAGLLGLRHTLIPAGPGVLSAFGLEAVDVRNDHVVTRVQRDDALDLGILAEAYEQLEARSREALARQSVPDEQVSFARSADLRYFGQAFEVRVPLPTGPLTRALADEAVSAFHEAHRRTYGYAYAGGDQVVEWVNLRVTGSAPVPRPRLRELPTGPADPGEARTGARPVYFEDPAEYVDTPLLDRARLRPGNELLGPAIVEEYGSTTVVPPGMRATVDRFGNLVLREAR
jgi:N-methylhydantoinase A